MKTDVEVSVTGLGDKMNEAVMGVTFHYGINSIPTCQLSFDAPKVESSGFLCSPDSYKKRSNKVNVKVQSITGCINFDGFFDGLSLSQSVGNFSYQAVIKNKYQRLMEIYPKCIGVMPSSYRMWGSIDQVKINHGNPEAVINSITIAQVPLNLDKSIGEVLLEYIKAIVQSQIDVTKLTNIDPNVNQLIKLLQEPIYKANKEESKDLLANTDLTYIKNCAIKGINCADSIVELTLGGHSDLMLQAFSYLGCCLLVGNNHMYIVPQALFLKGNNTKKAGINTAMPKDYNNFSVNDNGFVNIKSCHVIVDSSRLPSTFSRLAAVATTYSGIYPPDGNSEIPDDGSSGIYIVQASPFLMNGLNYGSCSNEFIQQTIKKGNPYFKDPVDDEDKVRKQLEAINKKWAGAAGPQKKLMDGYAKLKFLQAKYAERTGQLSTYFNPHWVPATTGSIYTDTPGIFINFYVTGVVHHIALSAPNTGTAVTSVSFGSARMGTNPPGIDTDDMFNYSKSDMEELQGKWVGDISK